MNQYLILSIIGDDKPGLVEGLSETIAKHQGNWLDSRMAHLADKFTGILTVTVPKQQEASLTQALHNLDKLGLHIMVERANVGQAMGQTLKLSLVGNDKPGIVKEVSQVLNGFLINVSELTTHCEPAPMSSEMLFKAEATLQASSALNVQELEQALERIASDLIVDIRISGVK